MITAMQRDSFTYVSDFSHRKNLLQLQTLTKRLLHAAIRLILHSFYSLIGLHKRIKLLISVISFLIVANEDDVDVVVRILFQPGLYGQ